MEQAFNKVEEMVTNAKEYVDIRIKRIKLEAAEKTAKLIADFIAGAIVFFLIFLFVGLSAAALSVYMGKVLGGLQWGLLFTGGIALLLGILLWAFRSSLVRYPLMNLFLRHLLTESDEEN